MQTTDVTRRFATLETREDLAAYNYRHFRTKHYLADARRTLTDDGIQPGEPAPDFELPRADGGSLRLSQLRDKPVLLHFGSIT
jgi:hypothetical protein